MALTPSDTSTHDVLAESNSTISGSMSAAEILPLLSQHGCEDITGQLDTSEVGPAICMGGFGDVHCGALQKGDKVAVKCLRMLGLNDGDDKHLKLAAHELYVWSKCRHRNILELLGVANYNNQIAMVSPWMANGDLPRYLSKYPEADRYDLVADAVAYLKDENMVHGDIKGANILVSENHIPKLTDFGTSALSKYTLAFTRGNGSQPGMSLRWTAPEVFVEGQGNTFESDVYALGMTILEAFTGSVPYANLHDRAVMGRLMQKVPPERPEGCIGDKYGDALWILITSSWDTVPENRPTAQWVRNILTAIQKSTKAANEFELTMSKFHNRSRVEVPPREPTYLSSISTGDFDFQTECVILKEDAQVMGNFFHAVHIASNELDEGNSPPWMDRSQGPSVYWGSIGGLFAQMKQNRTSQESNTVTVQADDHRDWGQKWKKEQNRPLQKSGKRSRRLDEIEPQYNHLLKKSRVVASGIVAMDFKMCMISLRHYYTTASLADKKRKLEKLIEDMKKTATSAEEIAQGFAYILRARGLPQLKGSRSLGDRMEKIHCRMQRINDSIEDISKSTMNPKSELNMHLERLRKNILVEGDAADRLIMAIMESLGGGQETSGNTETKGKMGGRINSADASRYLNEKVTELKSLEKDIFYLELLTAPSNGSKSSIEYIYERLRVFKKLWDVVRTDAETIHKQLNEAKKSSNEEEFRSLITGQSHIVSLCENMEMVLRCYRAAVTKEW
ncbi:Tyrosine-protein kinase SPK-1 [Girardia tigrina] [Rhizoctonia solani]|uniref:Tyrosine-protein kinase SPK-1 [Girardia tigrina] n=1 Tax=Rhizoctonia solani TaxID=456999 RepID=A0A0K6FZT4_9AGAM|nr:Tyrosine-protein kinase SPK-1 [Girardia tigrina] [Rhizoctonia solani]